MSDWSDGMLESARELIGEAANCIRQSGEDDYLVSQLRSWIKRLDAGPPGDAHPSPS